ncbi:MAG: RecX family transcriptional regulator [Oscillospiraceae bacterium]|nr:RecX family transcriptional regulator [Oscillospiraceae bacterium]
MRIDSISAQPDRAGRYRVTFAEGTVLRLYRQTVQDFGLYTGLELTEKQFAELETAAGAMSAKMRAVRIVSASNISKGDLEQRLIRKGEDPRQAKQAVAWMADMDLLDDEKTARQIVESCIRKGYGIARAKQSLYEKRIPKEYWDSALEDYPDQSEHIMAFLRTRLNTHWDERDLRRAIDGLIRRGHSYGQIRRVLQNMQLDTELMEEE